VSTLIRCVAFITTYDSNRRLVVAGRRFSKTNELCTIYYRRTLGFRHNSRFDFDVIQFDRSAHIAYVQAVGKFGILGNYSSAVANNIMTRYRGISYEHIIIKSRFF